MARTDTGPARGQEGYLGLIFDMDGVLADSEPLQSLAWVLLLARYGIELESGFFDRWIGIPNRETAQEIAQLHRLPREPEELIAEREPIYLGLVAERLRPFPGLPARFEALRGTPKALATSARRHEAERVLDALSLADHFSGVVTADDVSRTKPDPEPYLRAAAALALDPQRCVAIEDSPAGVASARAAGCRALAVTTTHQADRLGLAHGVYPSTLSALDEAARLLR